MPDLIELQEEVSQDVLSDFFRRRAPPEEAEDVSDHAFFPGASRAAIKGGLKFSGALRTITKSRHGSQTNIFPERIIGLEHAGHVMRHLTSSR